MVGRLRLLHVPVAEGILYGHLDPTNLKAKLMEGPWLGVTGGAACSHSSICVMYNLNNYTYMNSRLTA